MKMTTSQPRLSLVLTSEGDVSHEYGTTPTKKARTPTKTPEPTRDPRRTNAAVARLPDGQAEAHTCKLGEPIGQGGGCRAERALCGRSGKGKPQP